MSSPSRVVIGIDLGTTNSCVAVVQSGEPIVIPNAEGSRTTPSIVAFTEGGELRVGQPAKRQAVTNPERTIFAVKRLMGQLYESDETEKQKAAVPYHIVEGENKGAWVKIGERAYAPPEISAMVLQSMRETAEAFLGQSIEEAVITVPAYFNDAQRQATRDAAKIAGLDALRIINEPTAAALAYGFGNKTGQRVAVYDLGGGTFDISVLEIADGVFTVKATNGDTHLGGEDFDNIIVNKLAEEFFAQEGIDLRQDRVTLQRLKEQAERAKHELSSSLETDINLPFIAANASGPKHLVRTLKRSELDVWCADLIDKTMEPCRKALVDAKLNPADINEVILVGGMTRMPAVQKRVTDFFGRAPNKNVNPDEVVAVGAAIQGAALSGQVDEVLLLDVTPLSLGVEVGGGVFYKLIERNTTIPTMAKEIFTTSVDNQNFVPVHVLQGEREMASDNQTLAKFELAPILPAPRGVPQIEVMFSIDADGIVHVKAKDLGSGREQAIRIVASSSLSSAQIDQMISDAINFKELDVARKELAELQNSAEALIYSSERAIEECQSLVSPEVATQVQRDIFELRTLIETGGDAFSIREALTALEQSAFSMAESLYAPASDKPSSDPLV